ncbi:hypothetical protein NEMIN01_1491, partial [Nematocida minor]|uniref:uncharacterized protein n=1 Tax=Nematocida minor TaxID=1912983 RepID=UPI00221EF612
MVQLTRRAKDPNRLTKIELCAILNKMEISKATVRSSKKELVGEFKRNKKQLEKRQSEVISILKEIDAAKKQSKPAKEKEKRKDSGEQTRKKAKDAVQSEVSQPQETKKTRKAAVAASQDVEAQQNNKLKKAGETEKIKESTNDQGMTQEKKSVRVSHGKVPRKTQVRNNGSEVSQKDSEPQQTNNVSEQIDEKQENKQQIHTKEMEEVLRKYNKIIILGLTIGVLAVMMMHTLSSTNVQGGNVGVYSKIQSYLKQQVDSVAKKGIPSTKELLRKKEEEAHKAEMAVKQ